MPHACTATAPQLAAWQRPEPALLQRRGPAPTAGWVLQERGRDAQALTMSLWGTMRLKLASMRCSSARDTRRWNHDRKARLDMRALSSPSLMPREAQLSTSTGQAGDSCRIGQTPHGMAWQQRQARAWQI